MQHLTMIDLDKLGFEIIKSYTHDDFVTQRRQKGLIQVETTYRMPSGEFESQDLTIDEVFVFDFKLDELVSLDKILNK